LTKSSRPTSTRPAPTSARSPTAAAKLILYAGWADPLIPSPSTINYFNALAQTTFGAVSVGTIKQTQQFARLFMASGMWHCQAGPGPNSFRGMIQQPVPFDPQHNILNALTQARERHRWSRLRLRNLCRSHSGRHQDCLAQAAIAHRRRPPRLRAAMGNGGVAAAWVAVDARSRRRAADQPHRTAQAHTHISAASASRAASACALS
jgi:hypothetical protein